MAFFTEFGQAFLSALGTTGNPTFVGLFLSLFVVILPISFGIYTWSRFKEYVGRVLILKAVENHRRNAFRKASLSGKPVLVTSRRTLNSKAEAEVPSFSHIIGSASAVKVEVQNGPNTLRYGVYDLPHGRKMIPMDGMVVSLAYNFLREIATDQFGEGAKTGHQTVSH